jgi:predicted TPR repeat methyltransferase
LMVGDLDLMAKHHQAKPHFILGSRRFIKILSALIPQIRQSPYPTNIAEVERRFRHVATDYDQAIDMFKLFGSESILALFTKHAKAGDHSMKILDLGCGTGFTGKHFVRYARRLVGVDLSTHMIAKAQELNIYNELIVSEISQFCTASSDIFDLVVSVGVFCYVPDLTSIAASVAKVLRRGGYFVFTTDSHDNDDFDSLPSQNDPSLMVTHSAAFVRHALATNGFEILALESIVERLNWRDAGPVTGWCVLARKRP